MTRRQKARLGEVFAVPLLDGRYGAVRVVDVAEGGTTVLVGLTEWIGHAIPDLTEPALSRILRLYGLGARGWSSAAWYEPSVPPEFHRIGVLEGRPELHDFDDPFRGRMHVSMARYVLEEEAHRDGRTPPDPRRYASFSPPVEVARPPPMDLETFWRVIGHSGLDSPAVDDDDRVEPLVGRLVQRSEHEIIAFHQRLAERLHELDRAGVARALYGPDGGTPGQLPTPDQFLYDRCGILMAGADAVQSYLDPDSAPLPVVPCEALLFVADRAWHRRTGDPVEVEANVDYESFRNVAGWKAT